MQLLNHIHVYEMKTMFNDIKHIYLTLNMYNGKLGEQLLKQGGHSASLDIANKQQRAK